MDHVFSDTRTLLYLLISELVDHPNDVKIAMAPGAFATLFEVHLKKEDIRLVIGKKGRTVTALREILKAISGRNSGENRKFILDIMEPERTPHKSQKSYPDCHIDLNAEEDIDRLGEILERLVSAIVVDPSSVKIETIAGGQSIVLEINVAPDDLKRVIGRKGSTVNALRTLISNIASRIEHRVHILINEPPKSDSDHRR